MIRPPLLATLGVLASVAALGSASAQPSAAAVARGAGAQPTLAVGFDAQGTLRARVCRAAACSVVGGEAVSLPPEVTAARKKAKLAIVKLAKDRRAVHVSVEFVAKRWETVLVAPLQGAKPKVVFNGWTGLIEGEDGLRRGPMVQISEAARDGSRRVVVGAQREDLTLCGRPAILSPKLLLPADLGLHPAKVQRLGVAERNRAIRLAASREDNAELPATRTLRAVAATSGARPDALTDGDIETTWAENRGGAGRGEFVLMQSPPELPITGFDLVVRPKQATPKDAVAPKQLWLALPKDLFLVELPDDAWEHPGAHYRVKLPKPVASDCVALVVESAFDEGRKARVSFAELSALTELDAGDLPALVGSLAGGGPRAQAAGALLRSLGPQAFDAVDGAFDGLDEGGRRVALDVIDHAPCDVGVRVYARALVGRYNAHRIHARDRIRRCGEKSAATLVLAMKKAQPKLRPVIAAELAIVAPAEAVRSIVRLFPRASKKSRGLLRVALARAASSGKAEPAVRELLAKSGLRDVAAIDLLRSLGSRLPRMMPESSAAFARLAKPGASFRTRYLLLGPAAHLAVKDPAADRFLRRAITSDKSHHIRAQAARLVDRVDAYQPELLRALDDENVRVREAAAATVGKGGARFAAGKLVARLGSDPWPLVRATVARSLGNLGRGSEIDAALAAALEDGSKSVRRPVLLALGNRRALVHAEAVRERLEDDQEVAEVRSAAARSLGLMCDHGAVDLLTEHAAKLANPHASEAVREIGPAALWALGRLHPPDLASRLAPLQGREVRAAVRRIAKAALATRGECGGSI